MTKVTRPFTPEALVHDLTVAADPRISPDGTRVFHMQTAMDRGPQNPAGNPPPCDTSGANARQLTWSGTVNAGGRWPPDGESIAFISDGSGTTGIFVIPVASAGEAREGTSHRVPLTSLAWSPSSDRILHAGDARQSWQRGLPAPYPGLVHDAPGRPRLVMPAGRLLASLKREGVCQC